MKRHADHQHIVALAKGEHPVLQMMYREYLPQIISWVSKNKGTPADAKDIFQEAVLAIYNKATDPDFKLTCPLGAFVFRICKNKWINQLRKNNTREGVIKDEQLRYTDEWNFTPLIEQVEEEEIRQTKLEKAFAQLSDLCKKMLQLVSDGLAAADIATQLEMAKVSTLYRRKNACIERWKALYDGEN